MRSSIGEKKAFTLVELILVLILISITYYFVFSSNSFSPKEKKEKITLENLREYLLKNFQFEKELSFFCAKDDLTCYIKIDGVIDEEFKVKNFFETIPNVYEYNKIETVSEFEREKISNHKMDIFFEFKINSDYKTNEFILDNLNNKVYVFNSIYLKPLVFENLRDAFYIFTKGEIEVRDAF